MNTIKFDHTQASLKKAVIINDLPLTLYESVAMGFTKKADELVKLMDSGKSSKDICRNINDVSSPFNETEKIFAQFLLGRLDKKLKAIVKTLMGLAYVDLFLEIEDIPKKSQVLEKVINDSNSIFSEKAHPDMSEDDLFAKNMMVIGSFISEVHLI